MTTVYCSACNKSQHDVKTIIALRVGFICNECVALCSEIVEDDRIRRIVWKELDKRSKSEAQPAPKRSFIDRLLRRKLHRSEGCAA